MVDDAIEEAKETCRMVTADEIEHYREFGWVMLRNFVTPEATKRILRIGQQRMGHDGDSNLTASKLPTGDDRAISYFNAERGNGLEDPTMRALINKSARNAKALMGRRKPVGVKYCFDIFLPKLPSKMSAKNLGNGPTTFHQDFPNHSFDRTGGMAFWLALEDYGPESGTMSFVNGSHRLGLLGNYRTYKPGEDLLDIYPELHEEMTVSEPMTYAAGDMTVHSNLTVHGAGANMTDRPRWAYAVHFEPADVCWTGAPSEAYDHAGLVMNEPLPDDRFPTLA